MRRILLLMPLAMALAACGGSMKSKPAGPPLQTVQVSEKEFSLTPSTIGQGDRMYADRERAGGSRNPEPRR